MPRPRPQNFFERLAGVPVHYDRFEPPYGYGSRGKPYRFYILPELEEKLDNCFNELWKLCPYGQAEVITSAGAFVDKESFHGKGRAFDLDGIFWRERNFVTLEDGKYGVDRRFYFGVEAVLRKHFGTVLDYLYNRAHWDHFHIDDGQPVGFSPGSVSIVCFLQASLVYVFDLSVGASGIDGIYGPNTKAALQKALSQLEINGSINDIRVWLQFLTDVAKKAFGFSINEGLEGVGIPSNLRIGVPVEGQIFHLGETIAFEGTAEGAIAIEESVVETTTVSEGDVDIMARTIFGEARGESDTGKAAVGWVIMNRVGYARARGGYWWGNSIREVCLKPWQFSCWNQNNPNRHVIENVRAGEASFDRCLEIARNVIRHHIPNPVDGATHYYARYIDPPSWVYEGTFVIHLGVHSFYKDIP